MQWWGLRISACHAFEAASKKSWYIFQESFDTLLAKPWCCVADFHHREGTDVIIVLKVTNHRATVAYELVKGDPNFDSSTRPSSHYHRPTYSAGFPGCPPSWQWSRLVRLRRANTDPTVSVLDIAEGPSAQAIAPIRTLEGPNQVKLGLFLPMPQNIYEMTKSAPPKYT